MLQGIVTDLMEWRRILKLRVMVTPKIFTMIDGHSIDMNVILKDLGFPNSADGSGNPLDYRGGSNDVGSFYDITGVGKERTVSYNGKQSVDVVFNINPSAIAFYRSYFYDDGTRKERTYVKNHEGGHWYYMVNNIEAYRSYIQNLFKQGSKLDGGHRKDDKSGQQANEWENIKDIPE